MSLEGKLITVTGAASGIGRATAKLLASKKALLSLADIQEAPLKEVASELSNEGVQVFSQVVDIANRGNVESWIGETVKHFGRPLDGSANLAGIIGKSIHLEAGSIRNISDEEFDLVWTVHLKGTFNCLRAQLPHTKKGQNGQLGGSIVNCSSIAGLLAFTNNVSYCSAKAAIAEMTKCAAWEEGPNAIRVNAIAPGVIDTPMLGRANIPFSPLLAGTALGRKGSPEEVASLIAFLLSDDSSYVNATIHRVDGGWNC